MRERLAALCPFLTGGQLSQFETYYAMLVEWNTRMNLTALTEPAEVAEKHFADSLLPMALVPEGARCIDVGTGAGFPGVPILIARPDIRCVLLDSLNKRLTFLEARAFGAGEARACPRGGRRPLGYAARRVRCRLHARGGARVRSAGMDGPIFEGGRRIAAL